MAFPNQSTTLMSRHSEMFAILNISDQSYKASTIVIYDSRIVPDLNYTPYYDSRPVNYERKLFIRFATGGLNLDFTRNRLIKFQRN